MKKFLFVFLLLSFFAVASENAFAQTCDRSRLTPIKCGYYEEGYQDGANDARSNSSNDYRRYSSKFERQYETFYRSGYDDGYGRIRPFSRWTDRQKNTYDQGYDDGKSDNNRNISRLPARYEGQYERDFESYYQRGYFDGYDNRQKQYDVPITGIEPIPTPTPIGPGEGGNRRGTPTGSAIWNGRVDNVANVTIKANQITTTPIAGPVIPTYQNLIGSLPRRDATVSVRKLAGRGNVFVTQQPNRNNDYTAIVQIADPQRGMDDYNLQISWSASSKDEPYSAGKVVWRGRVDHTVSLRVFGESVESKDETGTGLSAVSFDMNGYLAARPGSVRVRKKDGRGSVYIVEQPSDSNDYVAVIRIFDDGGGADNYEIEIEW